MFINLSHSLEPIQSLLSGMGYLLGVVLFVSGLMKLKKTSESRGGGQEGRFPGVAFVVGGALLIYLPSSVSVLSNTFFGATNILSYATFVQDPFYHAMMLMIKTAGLIWFLRGTVLLIHASEPGQQHGPKGFTFLVAGILAMNIDNTIAASNYAFESFFAMLASMKGNI